MPLREAAGVEIKGSHAARLALLLAIGSGDTVVAMFFEGLPRSMKGMF